MKTPIFSGTATAVITPFKCGKADLQALRKIIEYQIKNGISAIVACGTTGEAPTLTDSEKLSVIETAAEVCSGRIPVVVGTTGNDTYRSSWLSREAVMAGGDAILAVAPYYNKPSQEGLYRHFVTIAESADKPVILYNIPSRTGIDLPFKLYERLSEHELIVGIKEASGNMSLASSIVSSFGESLPLYTGNDDLFLPTLAIGGIGGISVISNIFPSEMQKIYNLYRGGNAEEAKVLFHSLLPIMKALFAETNPIPVKCAMSYLGYCLPEIRLPLTEADTKTKELLKSQVETFIKKREFDNN